MATETQKNKTDRSLQYFHAEASAASLENAGAAYQLPSLVASGAEAKDVAWLSTLSNLMLSVLLIKIPSLVESNRSIKRVVLVFSFVSALSWLPLVGVLFFFGRVAPVWLIGLWILSLVPTLLTGPLRDNWLAETVPGKIMGRYLSLRSLISAVVFLSAFYGMGYILDLSGTAIFKGYAIVIFIAFIGSSLSYLLYRIIRAPRIEAPLPPESQFRFTDFMQEVRRGEMGRFVLYISSFSFAVNLCSAFFTVYMLKDLKFSYLAYTVIISAEYAARIVSLTFWGRVVDRSGSLKVLGIVSRIIPIVPVLWLFSHNVIYLVLVQLFSGTVWAAFDLTNQTFIYRQAPQARRLRYIIYHKSLTTFSMAAGALVGALSLKYMFPVFGSQILGLFLVSAVLRVIIVVGMLPRNRRFDEADRAQAEDMVRLSLRSVSVSPRCRLFHQPELWPGYINAAVNPVQNHLKVLPSPAPRGVFYRPEEWVEYRYSETGKKTRFKVSPLRSGLFYQPEAWAKYRQEKSVPKPAVCLYEAELEKARPIPLVLPP